jgi:hypothetical protein
MHNGIVVQQDSRQQLPVNYVHIFEGYVASLGNDVAYPRGEGPSKPQ